MRLLERAEELRLFDLRHFEDLLARCGGHPGASGLERTFRELVVEAGLAHPVMGFVEAGYELDVYWPNERFAVELDTYEAETLASRLGKPGAVEL